MSHILAQMEPHTHSQYLCYHKCDKIWFSWSQLQETTASQQLQHAVCNCPVTALWCLTVSSNLCVRLSFQSSCRGDAAPHRPPPLWRGSETWGSRWALLPGGRQPEGDHRVVTKWPTSGHIRGTWTDAANCFVWGESLLPERRRRQERSVPWGCLRLCGPEQCRQGHQP